MEIIVCIMTILIGFFFGFSVGYQSAVREILKSQSPDHTASDMRRERDEDDYWWNGGVPPDPDDG